MQPSKPRHRSSEVPNASTPSSSRSTRGSPGVPDTASSKPARPLQRNPVSKAAPSLPEKRVVRVSEAQRQLPGPVQGELRRAREERARALDEVDEMRQPLARKMGEGEDLGRIEMLEGEVEKARESERKMLESLTSQTKQLEEAKIELEEAKLEIRHLQVSIRDLEASASKSADHRLLGRFLDRPKPPADASPSHEDVARLRGELRSAIEAEEKNKKAMDDLALALKEVMTEMNQLKGELSTTQTELDTARAEADLSGSMLKTTEEQLHAVSEEAERLRLEADESTAAWNAKENGFIDCMKVSEEEITKLKRENFRLVESQRISREENSKLRDIMKQALNEATVVKEALEIARSENSQLKDLLADRENSLKAIKQDYENLKVSEAAALGSVEELKDLLEVASTTESTKASAPFDGGPPLAKPDAMLAREGLEARAMAKFRWEAGWTDDDPCTENGLLKDPGSACSGAFPGSMSERVTLPGKKDRTYASLSCVSDLTAPTSLHELDVGDVNPADDFDHLRGIHHLDGMNHNERGIPTKQRKKRQILRRFGDLLRRGGVQK